MQEYISFKNSHVGEVSSRFEKNELTFGMRAASKNLISVSLTESNVKRFLMELRY